MKSRIFLVTELDTDAYNRPKIGNTRVVKNKPTVFSRELAFELILDIPDLLFKRMVPVVNIDIPDNLFVVPDPEVAVSITAGKVAEALKIDVTKVEDILTQMVEEREANDPKVS
jgi:hypothetical protein